MQYFIFIQKYFIFIYDYPISVLILIALILSLLYLKNVMNELNLIYFFVILYVILFAICFFLIFNNRNEISQNNKEIKHSHILK